MLQQEPRANPPTGRPEEAIVYFGTFSLNLETAELRKAGGKIRLQNKPFQVLRALIEEPGRVVTRDHLRAHLWPQDTFVDFESGLNTAANRLRLALGDSAENPRYIETLPKVGYRFIAPLRHSIERSSTVELSVAPKATEPELVAPPTKDQQISPLPRWRVPILLVSVSLVAVGIAIGILVLRSFETHRTPVFQQLTFRSGAVDNARFTASGEVVYSAQWAGQDKHVYLMDTNSPESRELGLGESKLGAVSRTSDIALIRKPSDTALSQLFVSKLHGGAPRYIDKRISGADWSPDGSSMCLMRSGPGGWSLEYPVGKVLYRGAGWAGPPRVSPDGNYVAFADHPILFDDSGSIVVLDKQGHAQTMSADWSSIAGVAWNPKGDEIWFTAAKQGINRDVYAVDLKRHIRHVASMAAVLDLFDISPSGRILVGRSVSHMSMFVGDLPSQRIKDASWLDWSRAVALSRNGNDILFDESGEGGGPLYTVYLYHVDQGATERIGTGTAMDISADGQWILIGNHLNRSELKLISVAASREQTIRAPGLTYQSARFLPNSRNIVIEANDAQNRMGAYVQNVDTGQLRPLPTANILKNLVASPDGKHVAGYVSVNEIAVIDSDTGETATITVPVAYVPIAWPNDNELIVEGEADHDGVTLSKLNLQDHRLNKLRDLVFQAGRLKPEPFRLLVSGNLKTFAYSKEDVATGLFAVDGWS